MLLCPSGFIVLGSVGGDDVSFTDVVGDVDNPVVPRFDILPNVRTCKFCNAIVMLIRAYLI